MWGIISVHGTDDYGSELDIFGHGIKWKHGNVFVWENESSHLWSLFNGHKCFIVNAHFHWCTECTGHVSGSPSWVCSQMLIISVSAKCYTHMTLHRIQNLVEQKHKEMFSLLFRSRVWTNHYKLHFVWYQYTFVHNLFIKEHFTHAPV